MTERPRERGDTEIAGMTYIFPRPKGLRELTGGIISVRRMNGDGHTGQAAQQSDVLFDQVIPAMARKGPHPV